MTEDQAQGAAPGAVAWFPPVAHPETRKGERSVRGIATSLNGRCYRTNANRANEGDGVCRRRLLSDGASSTETPGRSLEA